jgi:hypothetical protein
VRNWSWARVAERLLEPLAGEPQAAG